MRNRWYSPRLAQFISRDPLGYVDSFNPYAYVSFDPINSWDPWGLDKKGFTPNGEPGNPNSPMTNGLKRMLREMLGTLRWATAGALGGALGIAQTGDPPDNHAVAYHLSAIVGSSIGMLGDAIGIVGGIGMMGGGGTLTLATGGLGAEVGVPAVAAGAGVFGASVGMAGVQSPRWERRSTG